MIRLQGPCGGIGRRGRLKICYPKDVGVRVSPGAPRLFMAFQLVFTLQPFPKTIPKPPRVLSHLMTILEECAISFSKLKETRYEYG